MRTITTSIAGMGRSACRVWDWAVERPVLAVVVASAAARLSIALVLNLFDIWSFAPDASQYLYIAEANVQGHLEESWQGYGASLYEATVPFSGQLSFLFELFGPYRLLGQLLAGFYGVLTAGLTAYLALRLLRPAFALLAGMIVAFLPSQIIFSSVALRESLVWALLAAAAVICSRLGPRVGRSSMVIGVAGLAVLFYLLASLRIQTAVIALWCMTLALVAARGHRRLRCGSAAVLFLVVPLLVGHSPGCMEFMAGSVSRLGMVRTYMAMDAESAIAEVEPLIVGSGATDGGDADAAPLPTVEGDHALIFDRVEYVDPFEQTFVLDGEGRAVVVHNELSASLSAFPSGLLAVTIRPGPWEAGTSGKRPAGGFESIIWLSLFVFAGVGAWVRRRESHLVALPASLVISLTLAAAVTQGNLGTAFRHRGQILFALSILAVAGLQAGIDHRQRGDDPT